ncbi:ABC transporter substrate-binding protein [uncultured Friedmanniella sp.]|uniref:ABC transporter substrate-binding protein n=1 Tax=uncultured Friedmanniella sp. TaxID=335381 RepID=UPI0035C97284
MKRPSWIVAVVVTALLTATAACSGAGGTSDSPSGTGGDGSATLHMALSSDLTTLDPTIGYQGSPVLTSVYEGLLDYAPDSTATIVPLLAASYAVSADGLTYTFKLRTDVKFADGTTMDSAAVKQSFERTTDKKVASQMAYMVGSVKSYDTPDPATFVIQLKTPVASFASLLASPFGPKIFDPKVLDEHKSDSAVAYLKTHTAGTGPYVVSSVNTGTEYTLTRNDTYWGAKPHFGSVSFKIIPDVATQVLQLQGGDLDVISGQPIATVQSFAGQDKFHIEAQPLLQKAWLHVNSTGTMADLKLRESLRAAIDRDALVKQVWGSYATPSTQMYPVASLPDGLAADSWTYDPAALKTLAAGKTITLGYIAGLSQDEQVAQALQAQWQQLGVDVTVVPTQGADYYGFSKDPSKAPDLLYEASYPDSAHPDAWGRLFFYSDQSQGSGGLNYLLTGSKEADTLMDDGLAELDPAKSAEDYGKAGDLLHNQVGYITLADMQDVFVARSGISGFGHWLPTPGTLVLKNLTETP